MVSQVGLGKALPYYYFCLWPNTVVAYFHCFAKWRDLGLLGLFHIVGRLLDAKCLRAKDGKPDHSYRTVKMQSAEDVVEWRCSADSCLTFHT